jgi:hypothetical protein
MDEVKKVANHFIKQHNQFKGLIIFNNKGNEIFSQL